MAGYIGQAQIEGFSIYLRSRLSYDAAAKASRAGKKAFAQAYGAVLKNMKESHQFRLELSLLYGQSGLGIVSANNAGVLTITSATWSTGTWATGLTNAVLEAWSTAANPAVQHNTDLTITSVSIVNQTVTVSGTSSAVVANDVLYFKGARTTTTYRECAGIYSILNNTGTLFNIDSSVYSLWQSNTYNVAGNLSLTSIFQAGALAVPFGLEKAVLICAPNKFAELASDEAALRRYVQDQSTTKRGAKGIEFLMGSVRVEILSHPLIRQGEAFMLSDMLHRVGATDVTFNLPGSGEPMNVQVTDQTAIEFRSMSDQGIFCDMPAQLVYLYGIT